MIVFGITGIRRKRSLLIKAALLLLLLLTLATLLINFALPAAAPVEETPVLSAEQPAEDKAEGAAPGEPLRVIYAVERHWQDMLRQTRYGE